MKKLLPLALIAALSLSAVACSDSDSCPTDLKFISLMADLNSVGPKDSGGIYVKEIDITNVETAVSECEAFVKSMEPIVTKNKDITGDKLKADWDAYKGADFLCQAGLTIDIAAQSVNFAINYPIIQANVQNCGGGAITLAAETTAQLSEQTQTLQGWSNILGQASKVTAAASQQQNSGK
ncbi:MAG: hypothetical protein IJU23_06735 [Proteobacteria bacterium]|nr:hypothetical protein [Pseudomonadota bacterium]